MSKATVKDARYWDGRTVSVKWCLADKPRHSGTRIGWVLKDSNYAPDDWYERRQECGAVGLAADFDSRDGIVVVFFLAKRYGIEKQTAVFAHVDDLEETTAAYSMPRNFDLTILEVSMLELCVDITGTPDEVQAMIGVSHKVEPTCFKKTRISDTHYKLYYRGDANSQGELLQALKRRVGLVKSKPKRTRKLESAPPVVPVPDDWVSGDSR